MENNNKGDTNPAGCCLALVVGAVLLMLLVGTSNQLTDLVIMPFAAIAAIVLVFLISAFFRR